MDVLIDSNVVLCTFQRSHPLYLSAVDSLAYFAGQTGNLFITPQIVAECWNVATRPREKNGFGLSHEEARKEVLSMDSCFRLIYETPDVYTEWKRLVAAYSVAGVKAHDARLVAAMNVNGIERILTFNTSDFARYENIIPVHPQLDPLLSAKG